MKLAIATRGPNDSLPRGALKQTYLSNDCRCIAKYWRMQTSDSQIDDDNPRSPSADLARRLERYRTRVAAEGRKRSLQVIDRAIRDASVGGATDV